MFYYLQTTFTIGFSMENELGKNYWDNRYQQNEIDVPNLEIHAFFEQTESAAMRIRTGRAGIKHHHGVCLPGASENQNAVGGRKRHPTAHRAVESISDRQQSQNYLMSFQ